MSLPSSPFASASSTLATLLLSSCNRACAVSLSFSSDNYNHIAIYAFNINVNYNSCSVRNRERSAGRAGIRSDVDGWRSCTIDYVHIDIGFHNHVHGAGVAIGVVPISSSLAPLNYKLSRRSPWQLACACQLSNFETSRIGCMLKKLDGCGRRLQWKKFIGTRRREDSAA